MVKISCKNEKSCWCEYDTNDYFLMPWSMNDRCYHVRAILLLSIHCMHQCLYIASYDIMGAQLRVSLKSLNTIECSDDPRGPWICLLWCRKTPVSRTAVRLILVVFRLFFQVVFSVFFQFYFSRFFFPVLFFQVFFFSFFSSFIFAGFLSSFIFAASFPDLQLFPGSRASRSFVVTAFSLAAKTGLERELRNKFLSALGHEFLSALGHEQHWDISSY